MNYLAHAYLSFNQPDILAGNMINDYVKGKKKFDYPLDIQKGMLLHRAIDHFTDHHSATQKAKQFFKTDYRLYAGAFVDVLYDHFLANDIAEFASDIELNLFCQTTYASLQNNFGFWVIFLQNVTKHGCEKCKKFPSKKFHILDSRLPNPKIFASVRGLDAPVPLARSLPTLSIRSAATLLLPFPISISATLLHRRRADLPRSRSSRSLPHLLHRQPSPSSPHFLHRGRPCPLRA